MISGFVDLVAPSDTQGFQLGTTFETEGATYVYLKAGAAITAYDAVQYGDDGVTSATSSATTTTVGAIPINLAIPQFAVAINQYFWAPCGPFLYKQDGTSFYVNAAASCAKDVKIYTTATAGVVDDAATTLISGLKLTQTITTAAAATCRAIKRLACNV